MLKSFNLNFSPKTFVIKNSHFCLDIMSKIYNMEKELNLECKIHALRIANVSGSMGLTQLMIAKLRRCRNKEDRVQVV